jgi:hypothetical protein
VRRIDTLGAYSTHSNYTDHTAHPCITLPIRPLAVYTLSLRSHIHCTYTAHSPSGHMHAFFAATHPHHNIFFPLLPIFSPFPPFPSPFLLFFSFASPVAPLSSRTYTQSASSGWRSRSTRSSSRRTCSRRTRTRSSHGSGSRSIMRQKIYQPLWACRARRHTGAPY